VDLYALPNILAGRALVPEFIQNKAVPETLGKAVELYILQPDKAKSVRKALAEIHHTLRRKANSGAADAAINLLKSRKRSKTI
jgi:lipid-A-disaccharide synthase